MNRCLIKLFQIHHVNKIFKIQVRSSSDQFLNVKKSYQVALNLARESQPGLSDSQIIQSQLEKF